ncbi:hypothetical protein [Synoicihabitans lomoniglobus]|uniref:Glycine zipper 2TM domain-containing protein n=1 Tax=Synoicihabitans lomoniglobus TaxID=2909285 RepID=A0AAF0CRR6_9BACT|nr:hypothetical protein [Opitutaceae bacterium LMO-M01]WED66771.1 hypothetical protein PXH66_07900 [Opitutaceae bacterium LMO-M01]
MKYPRIILRTAVFATAMGMVGCSFPASKPLVPASQAGVLHTVELGTIARVRSVVLKGSPSNLGLLAGGALGAAAAHPGHAPNTGERVGQVVAAGAGAVAGQAVEEVMTREDAQEITILMDNGRTVMITQESDGGLFREGDRVQVAHGHWNSLVRLAVN